MVWGVEIGGNSTLDTGFIHRDKILNVQIIKHFYLTFQS